MWGKIWTIYDFTCAGDWWLSVRKTPEEISNWVKFGRFLKLRKVLFLFFNFSKNSFSLGNRQEWLHSFRERVYSCKPEISWGWKDVESGRTKSSLPWFKGSGLPQPSALASKRSPKPPSRPSCLLSCEPSALKSCLRASGESGLAALPRWQLGTFLPALPARSQGSWACLLLRRERWTGVWRGPGGGARPGRSAAQAGGGRGRGTLGPQRCHPGHLRVHLRCHSRPWTWVVTGWGVRSFTDRVPHFSSPLSLGLGTLLSSWRQRASDTCSHPLGTEGDCFSGLKDNWPRIPSVCPSCRACAGLLCHLPELQSLGSRLREVTVDRTFPPARDRSLERTYFRSAPRPGNLKSTNEETLLAKIPWFCF